jgi:colicin import membrane protein
MRANSPSAFFASISLHLLAAAVIVLLSIMIQRAQNAEKPPVIFDLVAGPPTNPFAKEAPPEGVPDPVKFTAPKTQPKQPTPAVPVEDEADDLPVVKSPPKQTPPKTPPKPKNEPKQVTKNATPKMTYEEFKKKHGEPKVTKNASPRTGVKTPRINTDEIRRGVPGGAKGSTSKSLEGGGGTALTRAEMAEMDIYVTGLKNRLKYAHDELKPQGLGDTLSAEVEFFVSANGEIANIRITRSSGNAEFDASVREAFRRITWMGPRPDNRSDTWKLTFRMREED